MSLVLCALALNGDHIIHCIFHLYMMPYFNAVRVVRRQHLTMLVRATPCPLLICHVSKAMLHAFRDHGYTNI